MSTDIKLIARGTYTYGRRALVPGSPFFAGEKEAKILVLAGRADLADEPKERYETRELKAEQDKPKAKKGRGKNKGGKPSDPDGEVASQFYSRRDLRAEGDAE